MIIMYDSVTVSALPANAKAVAGYVGPPSSSNRWANFTELLARFYPQARCFAVAAQAYLIAACLDVEPGDATPAQAVGWFRMVRAHGQWRPCFYGGAQALSQVESELRAVGVARGEYRLWLAHWDGDARVPAGYDAKQYINHGPAGENYDISVLRDDFFPHKPHPKPKPKPPHPKVIGASAGAALTVALTALLHGVHVHITPAEASAIATIAAAVSGYITPSKRKAKT